MTEEDRPYGDLPVVECAETHWWLEREDGSTAWIDRCHACRCDL